LLTLVLGRFAVVGLLHQEGGLEALGRVLLLVQNLVGAAEVIILAGHVVRLV